MTTSSPLMVILIFQIVQSLINAVGIEAINQFAWLAWTNLPIKSKSKGAQDELRLRKDLAKVQKELNATSAQDDFAKWAKLRRQLDKLQEQYKQHSMSSSLGFSDLERPGVLTAGGVASSTSASKTSFDRSITAFRLVAINGTRFYLQWYYSKAPVYYLPKGWIPWYGEWLLSFPRAPTGSVSVQVWQFACGAVIGMVFEAVAALYALYVSAARAKASPDKEKSPESVK